MKLCLPRNRTISIHKTVRNEFLQFKITTAVSSCCSWCGCIEACILPAPYNFWIATEIENGKNKTPFNSIDSKTSTLSYTQTWIHRHMTGATCSTQPSLDVLFPHVHSIFSLVHTHTNIHTVHTGCAVICPIQVEKSPPFAERRVKNKVRLW